MMQKNFEKRLKSAGGKVISRVGEECAADQMMKALKSRVGAKDATFALMKTKWEIVDALEAWGYEDIDAGCVPGAFVHATMKDGEERVIDIVLAPGQKFPESDYQWHQQMQKEIFGIQWPDKLKFDVPNIAISDGNKLVHLKNFVAVTLQNIGWEVEYFPGPAWAKLLNPDGERVQLLLYPLFANSPK